MSSEDHKAKVRRVNDEVYKKGNVNAFDEIIAPDVVYHQPSRPDVKGLEAYKQYFREIQKTFSGLQMTFHDYIVEGETEALRYTLTGTHTGQMTGGLSIPPTGKRVTMTGLLMVRNANGKAVEQWNYIDMLGLMAQLGVTPPMG